MLSLQLQLICLSSATFLTEEERREVVLRLKLDRTSLADEYSKKYVMDAFKDWKIWVHMAITIGTSRNHHGRWAHLTLMQAFTPLFTPSRCSFPQSSRTWDTPTPTRSLSVSLLTSLAVSSPSVAATSLTA